MHKWRLSKTCAAILLSSLSAFAHAKLPPISFTALTDPLLTTQKNEAGFLSYKIVNTSNKTYHLTMQAKDGITQNLNVKNSCDEGLITLEPDQSCILSVQVRANETVENNNIGPILCDYDQEHLTPGECFEPSAEEKIRIKELKANQPSFSVEVKLPQKLNQGLIEERFKRCFSSFASCSITLFVGSQAGGQLKITNTSNQIIPKLQVYNYPVGVTPTPLQCKNIPKNGGTCIIKFTPGATHAVKPVTVRIAPSATPQPTDATITMQVLDVGDPFEGNKLFQLPFTSMNPTASYYTALAEDGSSSPVFGFDAADYCVNGSIVPSLMVLQQLRMASNCVNGPIGGFVCNDSSFYWSSSTSQANTYDVVNFKTGMISARATDAPSYIRCVKGYVLS